MAIRPCVSAIPEPPKLTPGFQCNPTNIKTQAAPFLTRALACLEGAVVNAEARGKADSILVTKENLAKFLAYRANGGVYEGNLMW